MTATQQEHLRTIRKAIEDARNGDDLDIYEYQDLLDEILTVVEAEIDAVQANIEKRGLGG